MVRMSVILMFLLSCVFKQKAFRYRVSFLTAICFIVSFRILRISLQITLCCCFLRSESNIFQVFVTFDQNGQKCEFLAANLPNWHF